MKNEIALFSFKEADGIALSIKLGESTVMRGYVSTGVLPLQNMIYTEITAKDLSTAIKSMDAGKTVSISTKDDIFDNIFKSQGAALSLDKFVKDNPSDNYIITIPIEINSTKDIVVDGANTNFTVILGSLCKLGGTGSLNINQDNVKLVISGELVSHPCSRCNLAPRKINGICIYDCGLESCLNSLDATDPTVEQRLNILGFKSVTVDEEVKLCLT